ncbi:putative patatin/cPLA2 family phospholipase [Lacrimispora xylanisolvens]|uniref:Putative patatin/cPLA2 family phospholipase n=1 Tax=Lacrimispora xylanisolvens TaxID=384636 RepID=A0A2S6HVF2_9FIRM|nr:patatin family protein [Hungatella xylanolytica]PPK81931.1 putative patatin/cPLA2 family phospholipase [Hungatella xylanolytica]
MTEGALVLEGGSLRGVFTAGVLDVFMEQGIEMSYVNGVSAGSMSGMSYVSKQIGRTIKVDLDYVNDKRFLSFRNLVEKRSIFNFDFLFGELSNTLVPFDYDTFYKSEQIFEVVATRCKTGKPEYFEKSRCDNFIDAVKASSSIPILSRMITVEGKKYLDGGCSMPVAYQRAIDLGYEKVVLVLTREPGYRKPPLDKWTKKGYERYFAPLPRFLKALEDVPERYNRMQEEIDRLEKEGRIYVIRPDHHVTVQRTEQDKRKLEALYQEGRRLALEHMDSLKAYLKLS